MTRSLRALTIALGMTSVGLVSWVEAGPTCPPKEILFLMDGSGSISAADFAIEKDGLQAAISNPNLVPLNGTIALGVLLLVVVGGLYNRYQYTKKTNAIITKEKERA